MLPSRCGPQTNTRMLLNYGTVDEDNPYDRLTVKVGGWVGGWVDGCMPSIRQIVWVGELVAELVSGRPN